MITVNSTINLTNQAVPPIIPVVQGDTGRAIAFTLADFTIPAGATATYYVQKPSGEAVYNSAEISGNTVTVELTAQSIIEVGENNLQVRIILDEAVVTSFDVILMVRPFRGIGAVESETEMNVFDKAVEQAKEEIDAAAQEAEEYISQAIDDTLTIAGKAADAKAVGDALATGYYPDLYAGGLTTDEGDTDRTPYTFRATPYQSDREQMEIDGVTVAWNQLVGTSDTSVTVTSGHKYYAVIGGTRSVGTSTGVALSVTGGTDIVIDLTVMFGSTIADYIYNLEQSTAGSGVAVVRKLLTKDYYPYCAPTLKSVTGLVSHDTVGFNQWDEVYESGDIVSGNNHAHSSRYRSKNYIPVLPNTLYYHSKNCVLVYYDADKTWIRDRAGGALSPRTFTTPENCHYLRFFVMSEGMVQGACINLSSERDGEYEPYVKHTYPLDSTLTLRGIMKLNGSTIYADGDVYAADGTVTRKYGWRMYQSGDATDGNTMITDGTVTVYKLTTPTTETADPYTTPQICAPDGTEEFVVTADADGAEVPVGHTTFYPVDLKGRLEGLPNDFSTLIAPTEAAYKATRNYTAGSLFIIKNVLYKATANIANGGTITPGTNCTATTLAEIISAL